MLYKNEFDLGFRASFIHVTNFKRPIMEENAGKRRRSVRVHLRDD